MAFYDQQQIESDMNTIYRNLYNKNPTGQVLPDENVRTSIQNMAKRMLYNEGIATNFKDLYSYLVNGADDARSEYFDVFNRLYFY